MKLRHCKTGLIISNISCTCLRHTHPLFRSSQTKLVTIDFLQSDLFTQNTAKLVSCCHVFFISIKQLRYNFYVQDIKELEHCLSLVGSTSSLTPFHCVLGTIPQEHVTSEISNTLHERYDLSLTELPSEINVKLEINLNDESSEFSISWITHHYVRSQYWSENVRRQQE